MSAALRAYLLSIAAAAFLCTIAASLLPKGNLRNITQFVCGLLLAVTVVKPAAEMDYSLISQAISKVLMQTEQTRTQVTVQNRELVSDIIKQKTEAYILDKAREWNMNVTVEVIMDGSDTYPYPCAVRISGRYTAEQAMRLKTMIERELAIAADRQEWSSA